MVHPPQRPSCPRSRCCGRLPLVVNLHCSLRYAHPCSLSTTCFKSTDGHADNWGFSTARPSLHLALLADATLSVEQPLILMYPRHPPLCPPPSCSGLSFATEPEGHSRSASIY